MMKQITPILSLTLGMPPCCLEFCPIDPEFLAVGTYKLLEPVNDVDAQQQAEEDKTAGEGVSNTQKRIGELYLFRLRKDRTGKIEL